MNEKIDFVDILKPRNTQFGILRFMTRSWVPKKTLILDKCYTPQELKNLVSNSVFMDTFLDAESARQGTTVEKLKRTMLEYLDEMGFEKKLHVVRWLGMVFLKICFMMRIGVFVNEPVVYKLKATMGNNPVLFLPTHRSYADFLLMTYMSFHYDIDLPAVAAGMDFHSMAVVGQRMRETCAFYMRRTLIGAPLYAATLRQYVRTIVAHHCAPIEFFIEGTRSRSNKSLPPRYGMLSMTLLPYFAREVTDVTIVPVNISYERLVELTLFAYEHLGVPKPRESTEGLLKSLQSLNDHFGNIYISLGSPISLNEFLNRDVTNTGETLNPVDLQVLTPEQTASVHAIGNHVVAMQQECTIVTITTLLCMVLMQCVIKNRSLHVDDVLKEAHWLVKVLRNLGARVHDSDIQAGLDRILVVHRRMFSLDGDKHLKLVSSVLMNVTNEVKYKMKGHTLKAETMVNAVPIIELQTYVNPVLHYLVPPAFVYLLVKSGHNTTEKCYTNYKLLRTLLSFEFFHIQKHEDATYNRVFEYCIENGAVAREEGSLTVGADERLQFLLEWAVLPALTTLIYCIDIMTEEKRCEHRRLLRLVQERGEERGGHPYSLSLDAAGNCLRGLVAADAMLRDRNGKVLHYVTVPGMMRKCRELVCSVLPQIRAEFGAGNCVITGRSPVASRL